MLTHHEAVEYSEQCIQEQLSSWTEPVNDIEEERLEIYQQESRFEFESF